MSKIKKELLIGLVGLKQSGKSTTAETLISGHSFARIKFAGALKAMVTTFLTQLQYDTPDIEDMIEGARKEEIIPEIGVSTRHLMQTLGHEWGRLQVAEDVWLTVIQEKINFAPEGFHLVIDDCRYQNEADFIRDNGGIIIRVERDEVTNSEDLHPSEQEMLNIPVDYVLKNNGDIADLVDNINVLMEQLKGE